MRYLIDDDDIEVLRVPYREYDREVYHSHDRNQYSKPPPQVILHLPVYGDVECSIACLGVAVTDIMIVREEVNLTTRLLQGRGTIDNKTLGTT